MDGVNFIDNTAHSDISLVHPDPLQFPWVAQSGRDGRPSQLGDETSQQEASMLIDPAGAAPCHPGGGGAVCLALSGISRNAPVLVRIANCNFTRNAASVGGALLISTEPTVNWQGNCLSRSAPVAEQLISDPCKALILRVVRFRGNTARHAGGAIFASDLHHVHYSPEPGSAADFDSQTLDEVATGPHFYRNRVGRHGYGSNVASVAVRLNISSPIRDAATGLLVANQSSGQSNRLPPIQIQILDRLGQVVSGGIVDSSLTISVDARNPKTGRSIAAGQVAATPVDGAAMFDYLSLSAPPGAYELVFSVRRSHIEAVSGTVALRECVLGERYNGQEFICEPCTSETFTFYTNVSRCEVCPVNAICSGGASLIPSSGHWHSSPFSVLVHECFSGDACSYDGRREVLRGQRNASLEEFLRSFDENDQPVFTNDAYTQCAVGYEGPLCGSCQDGYGQARGKSCVECNGKGATAAVILLLALWQLIFLSITLRSALVSVRDMSQMMVIAQREVASQPSRMERRTLNGSTRRRSAFLMLDQDGTAPAPRVSRTLTDLKEGTADIGALSDPSSSTHLSVTQPVPKQHLSADYIVAAQHVSETIKVTAPPCLSEVAQASLDTCQLLPSDLGRCEYQPGMDDLDQEYAGGHAYKPVPIPPFRTLCSVDSVAGFSNGADFSPMTCLLDSDSDLRSIHGVLLRIAVPVCLLVLILSVFYLQWCYKQRSSDIARTDCQPFLRSRVIIALLVVGFFSYQSLSRDLMGTVSCIQLDEEDMSEARAVDAAAQVSYSRFSIARGRYWTEDTRVECLSKNHAYLVGFLGIPGIVLFLCGMPLYLLIFLLYKRRQNQLTELNVLNTHGFIYQNYEDKFVYWEVCILVRKALIVAIVVFAYRLGANLQGIMALGVLVLALTAHMFAAPFKYVHLNVLEGCSLMVSILTFYAGVVLKDGNTSDSAKLLLSVLVAVVNSLLVVVILVTVFVYGDKSVVAKLKFLDVAHIPRNPVSRALLLASLMRRRIGLAASRLFHQTLRRTGLQKTTSAAESHGMTSPLPRTATQDANALTEVATVERDCH